MPRNDSLNLDGDDDDAKHIDPSDLGGPNIKFLILFKHSAPLKHPVKPL